jgi:hypothetical protein
MAKVYKGCCDCRCWQAEVITNKPLSDFNPRICDCDYCQQHTSGIISDPSMMVNLFGGELTIRQNGDQFANFYYCKGCGQFLAVGCYLNDHLRGAINHSLLEHANQFNSPIYIQPRLLTAEQKLERWAELWGELKVLPIEILAN